MKSRSSDRLVRVSSGNPGRQISLQGTKPVRWVSQTRAPPKTQPSLASGAFGNDWAEVVRHGFQEAGNHENRLDPDAMATDFLHDPNYSLM